MMRVGFLTFPLLFAGLLGGFLAPPDNVLAQASTSLPGDDVVASAVQNVQPSLVRIETIGGNQVIFGQRVTAHPRTGFFVSDNGLVLTAAINVAHEPTSIFATTDDGRRHPAMIVATDHSRNVVLLKVDMAGESVPVSQVLRSGMSVGQSAIAIGRAFESDKPGVSVGVISALDRIWGKAIQTDANVSALNYGGPLIDVGGNVLGILVPLSPRGTTVVDGQEWYDSGIGFAVPVDEIRLATLITGVDVHTGMAGFAFDESRGYQSEPIIKTCPANSPAGRAGILKGDRILAINQTEIQRVHHVRHMLGPMVSGEVASVQVQRGAAKLQFELTLVEEIAPWRHSMLGIMANEESGKVIVKHLISDFSNESGFLPEDVILEFPVGIEVKSIRALSERLGEFEVGAKVTCKVRRGEEVVNLNISTSHLDASPIAKLSPGDRDGKVDEGGSEPGRMTLVKVPEMSNVCHMYLPGFKEPAGLLMWLGEPGVIDLDMLLAQWQPWCDQTNTVMLFPKSTEHHRWTTDEIEFFEKVVVQVLGSTNIDRNRVAIGGEGTGGVISSITAMKTRERWKGLILVDAVSSKRVSKVQSESGFKQMILMLQTKPKPDAKGRLQADERRFREQGFPVALVQDVDALEKLVCDWIASLGRL